MKFFRVFKYWWWYNITVRRDVEHELMKFETYYYGRCYWASYSSRLSKKMHCKFRLCQKLFDKKSINNAMEK